MIKVTNTINKITNSDYVFSLIQKITNIFTGIITIALINRYLGVSLKGEYEYILNVVNILNVIFGLGLYASYPYMKRQKMENQLHKYLNVFSLQTIIYILISIIISVTVRSKIVIITSLLIITRILNAQLQNIGVVEFIRYRQVLQIVSYFIDLLLTLGVYLFVPKNMYALLYVLLLKYLIYIFAYLIKCKYIPKPWDVSLEFFKYMIRFGFVAMLTTLLMEFNYSIDVIIMRFFLPYSEIGLYSVGSKLAQYIWLIPDSFKEVLFSRTAKDDSIDEIKTVLKLNIFITLFMILAVFIFGKVFINLLYGKEYLDAYQVTIIIFLGIPSMVLYKLINPLYMANGKQKKCFAILFISVLINVIANFIFIPIYGKMGAAISTVLSYTMCGVVLFIDFIRTYHLKWQDCLILRKKDISSICHIFK